MLQDMDEQAQDRFLSELGETMLETAVMRTLSEVSEAQSTALSYYIRTNPSPDDLFLYLTKRCGGFTRILDEEVANLKQRMEAELATA